MKSAFSEVVEDYTELATLLIDRWSDHASKVASKLDQRSYNADSAVADVAACVTLATESGFLLASEALDAIAILTGREYQPVIVDSDPFSSPVPGAKLRLAGALVDGFGAGLPTEFIAIIPPELGPNATKFSLRADATGRPAGTYVGKVVASRPGGEDQEVTVWVTVA